MEAAIAAEAFIQADDLQIENNHLIKEMQAWQVLHGFSIHELPPKIDSEHGQSCKARPADRIPVESMGDINREERQGDPDGGEARWKSEGEMLLKYVLLV